MKNETIYFQGRELTRDEISTLAETMRNSLPQEQLEFDQLICKAYENQNRNAIYFQGRKLTHGEAFALLEKFSWEGLERNYDDLETFERNISIEYAKQRVMKEAGHLDEYIHDVAIDDPALDSKIACAVEKAKACKVDLAAELAYQNELIARSTRYIQLYLILWDMRRYAEEHGFSIYPGSTLTGGLTAYCLGITKWKDCSMHEREGFNLPISEEMPMVASGEAFRALYRYLYDTYDRQASILIENYLLHEDFIGLEDIMYP